MSVHKNIKKVTTHILQEMKLRGDKIAMLTLASPANYNSIIVPRHKRLRGFGHLHRHAQEKHWSPEQRYPGKLLTKCQN